nr:hypothetical protein GCM10020093_011080 [Planobispora longispora]
MAGYPHDEQDRSQAGTARLAVQRGCAYGAWRYGAVGAGTARTRARSRRRYGEPPHERDRRRSYGAHPAPAPGDPASRGPGPPGPRPLGTWEGEARTSVGCAVEGSWSRSAGGHSSRRRGRALVAQAFGLAGARGPGTVFTPAGMSARSALLACRRNRCGPYGCGPAPDDHGCSPPLKRTRGTVQG